MNLIWFLTIATLLASTLGEFGKYPFGNVGNAVNTLDVLTGITVGVFLIWKIGITKKIDFPKVYYFLIGFMAVGFLSLVVNLNFSGVLYLARFILYSLFFWIGYSLISDRNFRKNQLNGVVLVTGLAGAVLGLLQLFFYPDLTFLNRFGYDPHIYRLSGTFLDPNFLGAFLTFGYGVSVIFFLQENLKKYLLAIMMLFISVILTFSRSAWVMLAILNIFSIWLLPKKIIIWLVLVGVLVAVFVPKVQERIFGAFTIDISASERFNSWDKGIELFKMNPVFGIGFNNIRSVSMENGLLKPFTADGGNSGAGVDSSWLLIFATTGVLGGVLFGLFYLKIWLDFLKAFLKYNQKEYLIIVGLMTGFFIESQFINSLFYPPVMLIFFLITGACYGQIKNK